jgi:hypothetical protein
VADDLARGDLVEIRGAVEPISSRLRIVTRSRAHVTSALRLIINRLVA